MSESRPARWTRAARGLMAVVDFATDLTAVISGVLLMVLVLMITVAVFLRYYFHLSVGWSTELAEYFIYAAVMLGAPWVLRKDAHVIVDVVVATMSRKTQRRLAVFINLLGAAIGIAFFCYSLQATWENFVKGTETIRIMPIPRYLPLLLMPIMALLVTFQFLRKSWQKLFADETAARERAA